jgi:hypothetical protein
MTAALEGGEWSIARPNRTLLPGKTRYPLYRRLGGPQGQSGRAENLAPPGFVPRTVQPVVSRYTDWATWPTRFTDRACNFQLRQSWSTRRCLYCLWLLIDCTGRYLLWPSAVLCEGRSYIQNPMTRCAVVPERKSPFLQRLKLILPFEKTRHAVTRGRGFDFHNSSGRNMALGLIHLLTEMSTRNISRG